MDAIRFYDRALGRLTRRELLNVAWALGAAAVARPAAAQGVLSSPTFRADPFTLGVASGDPLADAVVLWTRLAPDPLNGGGMPARPVEVAWEIARDEGFKAIARRGTVIARPELGHSVHVDVDGLEAGRDYWYRFIAGGEASQIGRTRTAPGAEVMPARLRFGVCGCSHYEQGFFTGFRHIAGEHFDFIFHTGDYIYEASEEDVPRVREHHGPEAYTVGDYRSFYAQYKMDPDLIAAHASAPFIVSWDDHEVSNNYAGDAAADGTPPEVFALRRAAAYQAYFEAMPLRPRAIPSRGRMDVYRRLPFGRLVDLHVLDTRQFRSDQACGDGLKPRCPEALDARRSMLGAEQERWLFGNLANARGRWTVLGQQVYSFARDMQRADPAERFAMDRWDGYVAARRRLYARLKATRARNPIVLSGDIHQHFGSDLRLDFDKPESETIGVEFTNTSISSDGDGEDVAPNWERIRGDNPHIKYHSARRGYIACTATPAQLRADFMVLDRVSVRGAPVRVGGSMVVEDGKPGGTLA